MFVLPTNNLALKQVMTDNTRGTIRILHDVLGYQPIVHSVFDKNDSTLNMEQIYNILNEMSEKIEKVYQETPVRFVKRREHVLHIKSVLIMMMTQIVRQTMKKENKLLLQICFAYQNKIQELLKKLRSISKELAQQIEEIVELQEFFMLIQENIK
jgi:hypothetical protein